MKYFAIIFFCLFCFSAFSQESQYNEARRIAPELLQRDFAVLVEALEEVHPSLYAFTTKDSLDRLIAKTKASLSKPMTEGEFHLVVRQFIRQVRCGHTMAYPSKAWYTYQVNDSKLIPIEVALLDDKLFLTAVYDQVEVLQAGVEIVRINGADSQDIIRRMRAMQEIDGYNSTFEDRSIQKSFRTYFLFLYGRSESYEVHYLSVAQDTLQISLAGGVRKPKEEAAASEPATLSMTGAEFYLLEDNVGYLDLNSFSSDGYKKFYKSVFAQIAERSVEYLVLDLRGNGGGYFPNGNRLLAYLLEEDFEMKFSRPKQSIENDTHLDLPISSKMTNALFGIIPDRKDDDPHRNYSIKYKVKSKNAYRGKLYVLIDGGSFSMSGLVATRLKHASEAVFIGAETGGGEDGSNAIIRYMLTLPETQIRVMVPFYFMDHDVAPATKGRGVFPDYEINYSIEEVLSGKDKELQKVRALIEASR